MFCGLVWDYQRVPASDTHDVTSQFCCVWRPNQSLYVTKQAAHRLQKDFVGKSARFDISTTDTDKAVYFLKDNIGTLMINLHVSDSLVFFLRNPLESEFQSFSDSVCKVKQTFKPTLYLGIKTNAHPECTLILSPRKPTPPMPT